MIWNRKILLILFVAFFYFYLNTNFKRDQILNNEFLEFNNFDIYVKDDNTQSGQLKNLVHKINQFDSFVTYSYVDNSIDLFLHNSLKNTSKDRLDIYTSLFKIPTFNNLFKSIKQLSVDYMSECNKNMINLVISNIFEFCSSEDINNNISNDLLKSLVLDNRNFDSNYNEYIKIIVTSNKEFQSIKTKKNEYISLFEYINNLNRDGGNIKFIKFYNQFAFDCYNDFKEDNSTNIRSVYQPMAVFYEDNLESIYALTEQINKYSSNQTSTRSLIDYVTDSTLKGDKYKKIKNIYIYSSAYEKINTVSKRSIDKILSNLKDIEKNISNYGSIEDNDVIKKVNFIYEYFEQNKDNYKINFLINDYNLKAPKFVKDIANTEPIDLEFVDSFISNDYYNEIKNKYVVKVNLDNNSYLLYRKFLFLDNNSLYLSVKVQFLNLIMSIVIFLIFIIWIYKLKKN